MKRKDRALEADLHLHTAEDPLDGVDTQPKSLSPRLAMKF